MLVPCLVLGAAAGSVTQDGLCLDWFKIKPWASLSRTLRVLVGSLALLAAGVSPLPASADEPTRVRLSYAREAGTETCPDEAALRAAVIARLGRDPFLESARATVSVRMTALGQRVKALIQTDNLGEQSAGEREVSSDVRECTELVSSAALAIAIAIDPQLLARPAASDPPSNAASRPSAAEKPRAAARAQPAPAPSGRATPARTAAWYDLTLGAQGTWRGVPGLGLVADVRRSTRTSSVALEAAVGAEKTRLVAGGNVDVTSLQGVLVVCWRLSWLGLCGRGGLVAQRLAASGYPDARQGWLLDATFGPRLEVSGLLNPRWGLRSHLDAAISPRSVELERSDKVIGRLPHWGAGFGIGVFFRFP